jgi:methylated-DNA-[protein]-cysteine S-methyltransferase
MTRRGDKMQKEEKKDSPVEKIEKVKSDKGFNRETVYALLKTVPLGKVTTYGAIAKKLNSKAARAVGTMMATNPYAPVVPCHRVLKSDGSIGQFTNPGGVNRKVEMLSEEGVTVTNGKVDLTKFEHKF